MANYATSDDLYARYDRCSLAQLSNDINSTAADSDNTTAALSDATAEINTACLQGGIYTTTQLAALIATGDTQLVRMCCDGAAKFLCHRRMDDLPQGIQKRITAYEAMLEALRMGKRVLNIAINRQGELPATVTLTSLQKQNVGDITANEFFNNAEGTNTTDGSSG